MKGVLNNYSFDKFFELSFDHQKYVYMEGRIKRVCVEVKTVNNDEIFAMFQNEKTLSFTSTHFFVKSTNKYYIVYDKLTKKVRSNTKKSNHLGSAFMQYFFKSSLIIRNILIPLSLSNTFIKRVIENRINTVKDILDYHRSYVYRNKNISDLVLLNFHSFNQGHINLTTYQPYIKNWEMFADPDLCRRLFEMDKEQMKYANYQINDESDLNSFKLKRQYENWTNKISNEIDGQPY